LRISKTNIVAKLGALSLVFALLSPISESKASGLTLTFESPTNSRVILGDLASRTQRKLITVGGSVAPFTVTGSDSRGGTYQYLTDVNYTSIGRESDERNADGSYSSQSSVSYSGRTGLMYLSSSLGCTSGNNFGGITTYCAVFGPEVWTQPFDASVGQSLSFDYAATASDNYEVYAFLVKVEETSSGSATYDYGGGKAENSTNVLDSHTLILHRRGKTAAWTTASGSVPASGKYRFRFVDGAFDQTGGYALGTNFYIDPASVTVGQGQVITFTNPGDQVGATGTFSLTASSSSGQSVTFSSSTTNKCTVSGATVTKLATGTCTITADAAGGVVNGITYVSAASVTRSFDIRAASVQPSNSGLPTIFGTASTGTTLTIDDGTWSDGGSPVTSTTYQWIKTSSGVSSNISGATSNSFCLTSDLAGSTVKISVTKTNSIGSTTATSNSTSTITSTSGCTGTTSSAATITGVTSSDSILVVSFTAPSSDGGATISNYKYSTDGTNYFAFSPSQTSSPFTIRYLSTDGTTALVNGTSYPITIKAVNLNGDSTASNSVSGTPAVPSSSGGSSGGGSAAATPTTTPTPTATPRSNQTSSRVLAAPVMTGNRNTQSLLNPTTIIGGVPTTTTTRVIDQNKLNILAGQLSLEVKVADKQGSVGKSNSGDTELQVKKGGLATISGNGVRPLSTVQVFLPLQGSNSKEIGRITATNVGSFSGEALFATAIKEAPLPIGKQILQIVSLDKSGNQSVVEMPVNIAQPAPAPEQNRQSGLLPNQSFGTSFATSAGLPTKVVIEALEQDNKAIVQGDSWSMSINVPDTNGKVSKSGETAQLKFVQNKSVFVSGTGFLPNTRADIWLFSDPTLLGSVDIDQDGNFAGEIEAASNFVPVGEHTLQVQGVGDDGFVRSANLGVLVEAGSPSTLNGSIPLWAYATTAAALLTVFWFFVIKRRKEDEPKHIR
jgi:hypothetical protein